ncbi:MAG: hypothetical protein AAF471_00315 [Myxococcota bacterium]
MKRLSYRSKIALVIWLFAASAWSGTYKESRACRQQIVVAPMAGAHMLPSHHGKPFAFSNVGLSLGYEYPLRWWFLVGARLNSHLALILPGTMPDGSNYLDLYSDIQVTVKGRIPLCSSCKDILLGYASFGTGPSFMVANIVDTRPLWFGLGTNTEVGLEIPFVDWGGVLIGTGIKSSNYFGLELSDIEEKIGHDYYFSWNSMVGFIFAL